jgi:phage RecT family recombinase
MSQTEPMEGEEQMNIQAPIKSPMNELRTQVARMEGQWTAALPKHISVEKFQRVVMTAVMNSPSLVSVERRSLWNACTQAAQDGLLPDGREGAIVPFKGRAKWMPMYAGLIKKARNSGEIASIVARVVYDGDKYRYWIDEDGEHLIYEPADNPDLAVIKRVFAMVKLKDGTLLVEPMSRGEVEKVRAVSQTGHDKGAPWDIWWEEMAKKTAIRRLSKRLPTSPDLEQVIARDDELYEAAGKAAKPIKAVEIPDDEPQPVRVKSLEDFANGNGKHQRPEPKRSRGRPKKAEPEVADESEPEWLGRYREDIDKAKSFEDMEDAWKAAEPELDQASEETKAECSTLYNNAMDRLEEAAGE